MTQQHKKHLSKERLMVLLAFGIAVLLLMVIILLFYSQNAPFLRQSELSSTPFPASPTTTVESAFQDTPENVSAPPEPEPQPVIETSVESAPVFTPPTTQAETSPPRPTPSPTSAPSAETPAPPSEVKQVTRDTAFGLSLADTLPSKSDVELARRLDDMVELGVTWIRIDFNWRWIEATQDEPEWRDIDRVITAARERNIRVIPILLFSPTWARNERCQDSQRCPPEDPADYANFARLATQRYAPQGVDTWEIWNEPNFGSNWLPRASASEYSALLKAAYQSIKDVDPGATVLLGGLGATASTDTNIEMLDYLEQLYELGAQEYFDAVAVHPYTFPVLPSFDRSWNAWQQLAETSRSIRSIMAAYGDSDKKIWITEFGAPTGGPRTAVDNTFAYNFSNPSHVTEDFQAVIFTDSIKELERYNWDGPLIWYSYLDSGTSNNTIENFFGILRSDGSRKPIYDTIKETFGEE